MLTSVIHAAVERTDVDHTAVRADAEADCEMRKLTTSLPTEEASELWPTLSRQRLGIASI